MLRDKDKTDAARMINRTARLVKLSMFLTIAILVGSCGGSASNTNDYDGETTPPANVTRGVTPQPDAEVAVIETDFGHPIVIELYPNIAPNMVARFKQLINEGFYNGTTFHRIDPNLGIVQGGDPNSRDNDPGNDGMGNSNYPNVPAEFSDIPYDRGIVGAARQGGGMIMSEAQARDTANCQFYITLKRQPAFDQNYTVFGRVISGLNTADVISTAPIAEGTTDRPAERINVRRISLQLRANFMNGGTAVTPTPAARNSPAAQTSPTAQRSSSPAR